MSYREYAPPAALAPWLACTWERVGDDDGVPVRVVPDGCMDIVWTEGVGTQVVGANTTVFLVELAPGTRVVGARMRPGAAPPLLGLDARELRDGRADLAEVWGEAGRRLAALLDERADRTIALANALTDRANFAPWPDPLVAAAIARLDDDTISVTTLARDLAVSERQLRRRFASAVGYGPKRLARVLRLTRALDAARAGESDLARVAIEAGYFDSAHFAGDCRALAGAPPTTLLAA